MPFAHAAVGPAVVEAWDVVEAFEDRLSQDSGLELNLLDHYPSPKSSPQHLAHRGFGVTRPRTRNTGEFRDRELIRAEDLLEVALAFRLRPKDQRASRREAQQLAAGMRGLLSTHMWRAEFGVTWEDETELLHSSGDWLFITQRYTTARDAWVT